MRGWPFNSEGHRLLDTVSPTVPSRSLRSAEVVLFHSECKKTLLTLCPHPRGEQSFATWRTSPLRNFCVWLWGPTHALWEKALLLSFSCSFVLVSVFSWFKTNAQKPNNRCRTIVGFQYSACPAITELTLSYYPQNIQLWILRIDFRSHGTNRRWLVGRSADNGVRTASPQTLEFCSKTYYLLGFSLSPSLPLCL